MADDRKTALKVIEAREAMIAECRETFGDKAAQQLRAKLIGFHVVDGSSQ